MVESTSRKNFFTKWQINPPPSKKNILGAKECKIAKNEVWLNQNDYVKDQLVVIGKAREIQQVQVILQQPQHLYPFHL